MTPFDPAAKCPKCGHEEVNSTYHREEDCWKRQFTRWKGEHMHRLCKRCHHDWPEAVLERTKESRHGQ